jgi:hypothetical protein
MADKEKILTGGCLCGIVQYKVRDEFRYAMNCHCSQCRRVTGAAFKPFGGIERDKFTVARGAKNLSINGTPDTHDAFCKSCGSLLYSVVRDGAYVHVTYGSPHAVPDCAYLCRIEGAVVHHHRRIAAARGDVAPMATVDG